MMRNSESWGARVLLVDATGYDPLRLTWRVGHLITSPRRFTHRLYVHSWDEAMDQLGDLAQHEKLSELQFWGHGSSGRALIGTDALDMTYLQTSARFQRWVSLRPFLSTPSPLIWFRTCDTMKAEAGRLFSSKLAHLLRCRVAGYTQYIHVIQRGLVVAWPERPAQWSDDEEGGARVWFCNFSPAVLSPIWGATG